MDTPDSRADFAIKCVAERMSLKDACAAAGLTVAEFHATLGRVRDLAVAYARAREIRADLWADEIVDIADSATDYNKARNQIDARKWLASKHNHRTYGDRVDINVAQTISISDALAEAQLRVLRPACDQPAILDAEIIDDATPCASGPTDSASNSGPVAPPPGVPDIFS